MAFLERAANRGSISTGYNVDNSLKVQANSGNEWFYRNSPTAGNKKTFTFSFWIKRTQLDGYQADNYLMSQGSNARFHFAGHTLRFMFDGNSTELEAADRLRDTSAWYHIVLAVDTTQGTNTNRVKAYVNGQSYAFNNNDWPSQNQESSWMSGTNMYFNTRDGDGSYDNSGYWAEVAVVDGQQLTPTSFGEYSDDGIWIPKDLSDITWGNEGFYYKFDNASDIGADSSGNSNDATLNNITAADLAVDTPTNNFCTAFVDQYYNSTDSISHSEGATKLTTASGTGWRTNMATVSLASGKWYFESKHPGTIDGDAIMTSIVPTDRFTQSSYAGFYGGQSSGDGLGFYWDSTRFRYDDGSAITPPTNSISSGDILSMALDMDNNYVYSRINGGSWHNNGSANGDPTSGSNGTGGFAVADEPHMICTSMYHPGKTFHVNFGGHNSFPVSSAVSDANGYGIFEYTPPSGYYAICTKNLAEYG